LPEALLNFLGLMGWSFGGDREKFTLAEMVENFSFDRVALGGPVFDLEKLSWLNGLYIRELPAHELVRRLRGWLFSDEHLMRVAELVRSRIRRLDQFVPATEVFFAGDLDYKPLAQEVVAKGQKAKGAAGPAHRSPRPLRGDPRTVHRRQPRDGDPRLRRRAGAVDQRAVHGAAPGGDRAQRIATALRDHGGPRQGDRPPPHPPGRRAP